MAGFIITCPNCNHQFEPTDALWNDIDTSILTCWVTMMPSYWNKPLASFQKHNNLS
jgi:hypothetical protein